MLLMTALCTSASAPPRRKPNLLFMMADQLRADTQGADNRFGGHAHTPNLDKLASEGLRFTNAFSSTPTCTPARAGLLTGQSPWNHGMLGYGAVAPVYPFEMPVALTAVGYKTASIGKSCSLSCVSCADRLADLAYLALTASLGKDHFGWNSSRNLPPLDPKTDTGDVGSGTPHGYQRMTLYDGLTAQPDDGHQWFLREAAQSKGGTKPGDTWEKGWPTLNMNGWMGAPFVFAEYLHPTAWVGQQAVDWLTSVSENVPWFLKISFHRTVLALQRDFSRSLASPTDSVVATPPQGRTPLTTRLPAYSMPRRRRCCRRCSSPLMGGTRFSTAAPATPPGVDPRTSRLGAA